MLLDEMIAVYCGNYKEPVNILCGQNAEFSNLKTSAI
jgi:hypothetical protein